MDGTKIKAQRKTKMLATKALDTVEDSVRLAGNAALLAAPRPPLLRSMLGAARRALYGYD